MVSLFASSIIEDERLTKNLSIILRIISDVQPILFKRLVRQRDILDQCILYFERNRSTDSSMSKKIEENLRNELEATIVCCQQALSRLGSSTGTINNITTPKLQRKRSSVVSLSSQSQPNSFEDIQNRLYQNQSVMNLIEPYLSKTKLFLLIDHLSDKVTMDKQMLLAYSHVKSHEKQLAANEPLLPLFKRFASSFERKIEEKTPKKEKQKNSFSS